MSDPVSSQSIADYLKLGDCIDELQPIIDAAIASARSYTGYDLNHGEGRRVQYFKTMHESLCLPDDETQWKLEIHNGDWEILDAEQIGDTLCINGSCACNCACSGCNGAPRIRLTTWKKCGLIEADIQLYVREYVAYVYYNRGDLDRTKLTDLVMMFLKPHMSAAFV